MHKPLTALLLAAALASPIPAQTPPLQAQPQAKPAGGPALPPEYRAYLGDTGAKLESYVTLPAEGSIADKRDRAAFKESRKLVGTPRWALAQADAGRGILKAFSCAAGINLTPENAGALTTLLSRYRTDLINVTRVVGGNATLRPYERDKGPVCIADKALKTATGTPAIQSAWGWTVAMILSEALPARTDALMQRGRAYGESAGLCGFASISEVLGGRDLAAGVLARARGDAGFSADLAKATAQVGALTTTGMSVPEGCAAENALTAKALY